MIVGMLKELLAWLKRRKAKRTTRLAAGNAISSAGEPDADLSGDLAPILVAEVSVEEINRSETARGGLNDIGDGQARVLRSRKPATPLS